MLVLKLHSRHFTRALQSIPFTKRLVGSSTISSPPKKCLTEPAVDFKWPFPDFRKGQWFWELKSRLTIFLVGLGGRTLLSILNTTKVHNREILVDAIFKRPPGVPLITVANHESCMDDPALIALSVRQLTDQKNMRWTLAAHDICFTRPFHSAFFSLGKSIPIVRGLGVYQKPMDFAIDRLNSFGDWLHIFPEGRVNVERTNLYRFKWGIGRIISELKTTPIVLPIYHTGMSDVLPNRRPYIPRFGNKVFLNVGQPLPIQSIIDSTRDLSPRDKRKAITDFIQMEMGNLREATLKLSEEYRNGILKGR